ncbi:LysR family transcriptional regulator [Paraburkholderia sacchari]|uniref:LysR family transcriptional regulator n=1 Tax=Paraburkholderia sacchari TaxID=159450 RepID=A0A8T6ZGY8_9BURK|nr:LysR family transcriptional regulator [Paraburkholderia sacchari]NLP63773.1 LysR family transcriptional regulator [Paraburkholderia sacchari]
MNQIDIGSVDLNLFKVFEALFEEGGASRAAIRLDMTQSAVSAALRRLREVFSDALFVRTGRGLAPTSRARELKPIVSEALDRCRQSLAIASPNAMTFHGRSVSIGLSDDFEIAIGRRLIDVLSTSAPGLRLIFRQTHSQIVGDALANQEMDLAVSGAVFGSRGLRQQILGEGTYACLVDAGRRRQPTLTIDEYVSKGHILVSSGGVVGIVDEALAALGRRTYLLQSALLRFLWKVSQQVGILSTDQAAFKTAAGCAARSPQARRSHLCERDGHGRYQAQILPDR